MSGLYYGFKNPYAGMPKFDSKHLPFVIERGFEVMTGERLDANETAIFARQLEHILSETYETVYPEHKARLLIPVDTRVPSGAETFTYRMFDKVGEAAIINSYADDFPNADIIGEETPQRIVSLGTSFQYNIQDLRGAAMAGVALEAEKAKAARFVMENKLETLAAGGDTNTGLVGLANATGIQTVTKVSQNNAGATTSTWEALITDALAKGDLTKAVQEILKDINAMQRAIFDATEGTSTPDTLVLTTKCYSLLNSTQRAPGFTDDTILQYILKTSPWLKSIDFWSRLNGLAPLAGGGANRGLNMMYQKNPRVLGLIISQDFEQFAPQPRNMAFVVPCHLRTGAVEVRYPKAVARMVGCD